MQRQVPSKTVDHLACAEPNLVESARQGNEEAFRVIIMQHNRRLYRTALAIVGIPSEAEDVVQECFVRAFTNLAQFRGDSSLATWLTRIAVNEALGRRRRCRGTLDLAVVENRQASDAQIRSSLQHSNPERSVAQHQIHAILERAIEDLPEGFRSVLVARVIDDLTVEETAELFGLRRETVKTRLHRARTMLKEAVARQVGAEPTREFPFADYIPANP
jgi:RNA polymerase sigma-70 factor (ECF subfamily)